MLSSPRVYRETGGPEQSNHTVVIRGHAVTAFFLSGARSGVRPPAPGSEALETEEE
jgi:hypothetical protein